MKTIKLVMHEIKTEFGIEFDLKLFFVFGSLKIELKNLFVDV